ncbi:MAG: hypothetical protein OXF68_02480 [Gammaproteobacteria bacterium]|nr:hypothetical protein [Gammaproteobacteria bacterium]
MAWITFAVLAPINAAASIVAGLLGPIDIAVYAAALSLPGCCTPCFAGARRGAETE